MLRWPVRARDACLYLRFGLSTSQAPESKSIASQSQSQQRNMPNAPPGGSGGWREGVGVEEGALAKLLKAVKSWRADPSGKYENMKI